MALGSGKYDRLARKMGVRVASEGFADRVGSLIDFYFVLRRADNQQMIGEFDDNPDMPQVDVALVIGANDVVNPAARTDRGSPIYGMPIIDADRAKACLAIKRSKNPGFAGIDNALYFQENTLMVFGDAKAVVASIVASVKGEGGGLH